MGKKEKKRAAAARMAAALGDGSEEEGGGSSGREEGGAKAGVKGAAAFALLGDDDEDVDDAQQEPIVSERRKAKGGASSGFAALGSGGEEDDDEEDADVSLRESSSRKAPTSAFAALALEGDEGDDDDDEEQQTVVAPSAGKGKSKSGTKDLKGVETVLVGSDDDSQEDDEASLKIDLNLKPKRKGQKTKSNAGRAAGLDTIIVGDDSSDENGDALDLDVLGAGKKAKGKAKSALQPRGGKDKASLSESQGGDMIEFGFGSDEEPGDDVAAKSSSLKSKNKGKAAPDHGAGKKGKDMSAYEAERSRGSAAMETARAKEKSGKEKEELDALLLELEGEGATEDKAAATSGGKKKKKGKGKSVEKHEEDLDSLLAAIDGGTAANKVDSGAALFGEEEKERANGEVAAPLTAAQKKKMKKKQKKSPGAEDEDLDALLADFGVAAGPKEASSAAAAAAAAAAVPIDDTQTPSPESAAHEQAAAAASAAIGDIDAAPEELDESKLTAAQKKRLRKKQKEKAEKEGAVLGSQDDARTDAQGAAPAQAAEPSKKGKESAAVRKMREEVEKRRLEQEKAEHARLEAARAAEAAARAEELAQQEAAAARERKRESERLRKEQLRKEGKLLTKAQQEKQRKAEQYKQQLIDQGLIPAMAATGGSSADAAKPKRVVYETRKKKPGPSKQSPTPQQEQGETRAETSRAIAGSAAPLPSAAGVSTANKERVESHDAAAAASWDDEDWDSRATALVAQAKSENDDEDLDAILARQREEQLSKLLSGDDAPMESAGENDVVRISGQDEKRAAKSSGEEESSADGASSSGEEEADSEDASEASDDDEEEEESDSEYSSSEDDVVLTKQEIERRKRVLAIRLKRQELRKEALLCASKERLRSPVVCILGHVDTGKTKILDRIRRTNVQNGEAGGITQQIGATYMPMDAVRKEVDKLGLRDMVYRLPSLLVIDTPGHESFTNLRTRGSSLCDIAILVVDIMHGLEPQTIESINLLRNRKNPFVVALNKVDRLFDWKAGKDCGVQDSLKQQKKHVLGEFKDRVAQTKLAFAEIGLNVELYWENKDPRRTISLIPTSAHTGEGIPDLLMMLVTLSQRMLEQRLMFIDSLQCTVIEVKMIEGLGTTIDVVLTAGHLEEGATIVVCGLDGPIVTRVRGLLTPHPMKEMRVKGQYLHHKKLEAAVGIKIMAEGLEKAVAGTQLLVPMRADDHDEIDYLKEEVVKDMETILQSVNKTGEGVYVQASTLGSLEALLDFLRSSKIPVSGINIGPVNKRDVMKCSTMLEKKKEYALILAFDVKVERDARAHAEELGIPIFTADIIYHLFDQFTEYMLGVKKRQQQEAMSDAVFPVVMRILPECVFNKKSPLVLGCEILEGMLKLNAPMAVKTDYGGAVDGVLEIGRVLGIEVDKKAVSEAKAGQNVAVKIGGGNYDHILFGRHLDMENEIYSRLTRKSIDVLKEHFRDELSREDWQTVIKLKQMFNIK
ncbi:Eukaryotic translation initiation factor 5B [Porphyridium purpureum]|uniref:Eukaryotic translation initiation factor 5B n=1 Tax=Porphyridium purpureum TaxID=35688 RepID=A0A5J4Z8E2_PORPP|nr:Eukaryotic translation initiation factor 5B [Porphyridium purpureum]|eukprot:POR1424..scf295_1